MGWERVNYRVGEGGNGRGDCVTAASYAASVWIIIVNSRVFAVIY